MSNAPAASDPVQRAAWVFPGLFVVLWSTGFIGAKLGLPYAEPATFLEIRFIAVLAVLLPLCWLVRAPWPQTQAEFWHMAFAGALIQGGYLGGVFLSLSHGMPAGVSSLITALQPILAAVLSGWLLGERTNARQWLGLGIGIVGVALVVREKWLLEGVGFGATALSVLALVSISLGAIWQKRHCARVDLRTGAAIQFARRIPGALALRLAVRDTAGCVERRVDHRNRLAGLRAVPRRGVPAVLADPARGGHQGGEPDVPGAALHRAGGLAAVRRDLYCILGGRHGARHAGRLAREQGMSLDYRPDDPAFLADPFPLFRRMQDEDPCHWSPRLKAWVLTRYEDVRRVCLDKDMSSDRLRPVLRHAAAGGGQRIAELMRYLTLWMVFRDAPEHTRLRRLTSKVFHVKSMHAHAPAHRGAHAVAVRAHRRARRVRLHRRVRRDRCRRW